jgi:hypothetical protein
MLNRVDFPLTKAHVMDFILDREYISFPILMKAIGELVDEELVQVESLSNRTHLIITAEGVDTLSYFRHRIGEAMRADIDDYFRKNELKMRNETSILSDYYKSTSGEYEARLIARDSGITLIDLTLSVSDEETASQVCDSWHRKNQEVYKYLIETLF